MRAARRAGLQRATKAASRTAGGRDLAPIAARSGGARPGTSFVKSRGGGSGASFKSSSPLQRNPRGRLPQMQSQSQPGRTRSSAPERSVVQRRTKQGQAPKMVTSLSFSGPLSSLGQKKPPRKQERKPLLSRSLSAGGRLPEISSIDGRGS